MEVRKRLRRNDGFRLIDVREQEERDYCRIEGSQLKPMSQIMRWIHDLGPEEEYVFVCHHGIRSDQVCVLAHASVIANVADLTGGIGAWSDSVDPAVPKY